MVHFIRLDAKLVGKKWQMDKILSTSGYSDNYGNTTGTILISYTRNKHAVTQALFTINPG